MEPLRAEKKPWTARLQPVVGALVIVLGLAPATMAVAKGLEWSKIQPLLGGLLMVGGGAMLIKRGTRSMARFWAFLLAAVALTAALALVVRSR